MRIAGFVIILCAARIAAADPDGETGDVTPQRLAADMFDASLAMNRPDQVAALFASKVTIGDLAFTDAACERAFGRRKVRTVARAKHLKLATCLLGLSWDLDQMPVVEADRATIAIGGGTAIVLRFAPDEHARITRIERVKRMQIVEDDVPEANGDVGGEHGGTMTPPPPPPPKNVVPTTFEAARTSGVRDIKPDATTEIEMTRSGKTKVVAAYKVCVDAAGAVSSVNQLKSSGFPTYDAELQAGIKAWTFQPFVVEGGAVPACSAVTFVYSVK